MSTWTSLIVGAILGVVFDICIKGIWKIIIRRKEVEDNNNINISGDWFAAWQTSVDNQQLLNTESLKIKQQGKNVVVHNCERAPENPRGGYLWRAKLQFYQGRNLMGWYFPLKSENNASKGIMYMTYFSQRREFYGKWIGSGYDGELEVGFLVFAQTREGAKEKLKKLIQNHPHDVKVIGYDM